LSLLRVRKPAASAHPLLRALPPPLAHSQATSSPAGWSD